MARFDVQDHEVLLTSAISDGYAPRILLNCLESTTATPCKTWLYFEPVPGLYAAKAGIGFGKTGHGAPGNGGSKYWVYLDRSCFEDVCDALSGNSSLGVRLAERTHPGAAGANRLVTAIDLVLPSVAAIDVTDGHSSLLSTSA